MTKYSRTHTLQARYAICPIPYILLACQRWALPDRSPTTHGTTGTHSFAEGRPMSCPFIVLEVLQQCNLHGAPRRVYIALAAYTAQYGPQVFPSLVTLAQAADVSERH